MTAELVGASVWEEELYRHLTTHARNERELLVNYQDAASESGSQAFQYLVNLIVEEEVRHHRLFEELAQALRTDAEMRREPPAVPRLDHWGARPELVVELTERMLAQEHQDQQELRQLSKQLVDVKDTTLWQLLVRLMQLDTEKHVEILEFVRKHAKRVARADRRSTLDLTSS